MQFVCEQDSCFAWVDWRQLGIELSNAQAILTRRSLRNIFCIVFTISLVS